MDQVGKEKLLQRMRQALKQGRKTRKIDRRWARIAQGDVRSAGFTEADVTFVQNVAASRNMLLREERVLPNGIKLKPGDVDFQTPEKYEKRPSVRALKKSRSKGRSVGI